MVEEGKVFKEIIISLMDLKKFHVHLQKSLKIL